MTRHDEGKGIAPVGRADRPHRSWTTDLTGQLGVAARFAIRNGRQGLPDGFLKRRAGRIEREGEGSAPSRKIFAKLAGRLAENRLRGIFLEGTQRHAAGIFVFPQNRRKAAVRRDELERADG